LQVLTAACIRWQRDEEQTMELPSTVIEIEAHEPESED
jgi:hypothetical protein